MKDLNRIKTSNGFESRGNLYTSVFLRYSFPYHDCFVYVDHRWCQSINSSSVFNQKRKLQKCFRWFVNEQIILGIAKHALLKIFWDDKIETELENGCKISIAKSFKRSLNDGNKYHQLIKGIRISILITNSSM